MLHKDTKEDYLTNPINQGWLMKEGTKLYMYFCLPLGLADICF